MTAARQIRGARARRDGRKGEWLAAAWLMLHGWRILGFRVRTPLGEIDLIARRGGVLAMVEVKRRSALDDALAAISPAQQLRLARAASALCAQRPGWRNADVRLDLVALAPGRWPVHVPDAWRARS